MIVNFIITVATSGLIGILIKYLLDKKTKKEIGLIKFENDKSLQMIKHQYEKS